MKLKMLIGGCLIGASFFLSCTSGENEQSKTDAAVKKEIVNPNGDSELALLMRQMFDESMVAKNLILDGQPAPDFSDQFVTIHTAQETDSTVRTVEFRALSEVFLTQVRRLEEAPAEERVAAHNNMVASCLACHRVYCPGPMVKIKKLKIAES
jgi:cytochrome c556